MFKLILNPLSLYLSISKSEVYCAFTLNGITLPNFHLVTVFSIKCFFTIHSYVYLFGSCTSESLVPLLYILSNFFNNNQSYIQTRTASSLVLIFKISRILILHHCTTRFCLPYILCHTHVRSYIVIFFLHAYISAFLLCVCSILYVVWPLPSLELDVSLKKERKKDKTKQPLSVILIHYMHLSYSLCIVALQ